MAEYSLCIVDLASILDSVCRTYGGAFESMSRGPKSDLQRFVKSFVDDTDTGPLRKTEVGQLGTKTFEERKIP